MSESLCRSKSNGTTSPSRLKISVMSQKYHSLNLLCFSVSEPLLLHCVYHTYLFCTFTYVSHQPKRYHKGDGCCIQLQKSNKNAYDCDVECFVCLFVCFVYFLWAGTYLFVLSFLVPFVPPGKVKFSPVVYAQLGCLCYRVQTMIWEHKGDLWWL